MIQVRCNLQAGIKRIMLLKGTEKSYI